MKSTIESYLKAGYPAVSITTTETLRVSAIIQAIGKERQWPTFQWDPHDGGLTEMNTGNQHQESPEDPDALLQVVRNTKIQGDEHIIFIIEDFHLFYPADNPPPDMVSLLKSAIRHCRRHHGMIHLLFVGARRIELPEVERDIGHIEFKLPGNEELGVIVDTMAEAQGVTVNGQRHAIISALSGLTTIEAENALSLSFVRTKGKFDPHDIGMEKAQLVKKTGLLEIVHSKLTLDDIGGLHKFKRWVKARARGFTPEARAAGLPWPKGILLLGLPGTGKSLGAKAIAAALGLPILRLDMGALFGSLVGQSEANMRLAIETAEAMAGEGGVILWIDEIDKGIGGASGGTQDGGTSDRVLGTMLTWMQDKTSPVFIYATANDPYRLSASDGALVRKGRFDEMFFVDLPTPQEREAIWKLKLKAAGISDLFDQALVVDSSGFTGAEIESVVLEARWNAFDEGRAAFVVDLQMALESTVPLSSTMEDKINSTRKWAAGRCRPASEAAPISNMQTQLMGNRKLTTD
jgi:AAA+ superfamily predicted ATPase